MLSRLWFVLVGLFAACGFAEDQAVVSWIKSSAIPLKTVEAGGGFDDMQPIRQIVGDARIVSLGESTHGTREHFQMKHRMLEFLVNEMGFTLFGIEASMPDCTPINDYVLNGAGDPERAVAGQGFWTWNTQEVLEMVKWMRAYNADPSHARKLKFYGFDMQQDRAAVNYTLKFLERVDPENVAKFKEILADDFKFAFIAGQGNSQDVERISRGVVALGAQLDDHRQAYIARSSADDFAMARRCVDIAGQAFELVRDMRKRSSSLGPMKDMDLMINGKTYAQQLLDYLKEHNTDLARSSEELLAAIIDYDHLPAAYEAASAAKRTAWDDQAAAIRKALAGDENAVKARVWADEVSNILLVFREFVGRKNEPTIENIRDRCMAGNIKWILEHEGPGAKIVCWAHNGHVQRTEPGDSGHVMTMGVYLSRLFGPAHKCIGFSFNRGSFQAVPAQTAQRGAGTQEWTVGPANAQSVDATLAQAGLTLFILDLQRADRPGWFNQAHDMRVVGALFDPAVETTDYYTPIALSKSYDAIIFTDSTTRARPNKIPAFPALDPTAASMGRPRMGVRLEESRDGSPGMKVLEVFPETPAANAGIVPGDRLMKVGGDPVKNMGELGAAMRKIKPEDPIPVTILRAEKEVQLELKPIKARK